MQRTSPHSGKREHGIRQEAEMATSRASVTQTGVHQVMNSNLDDSISLKRF
jgi:hypothetical protein